MELGKLCDVVRGSSPRPQGDSRYYGGMIPRLMVSDLTRDGMYVTPQVDSLTEEGAKLSRPMKKGDVVIAVSGNPGLPAILNSDACIHDGFVGLRNLNNKLILNEFLYYFLKFNKEKNHSKAVGAIFKNLTTDQLKEIKVPLPDLKTQQKITNILEQADAALQKRKNANQLPEQFLQSVFFEMFGDLVKNSKGWETKPLCDLVTKLGDGLHGTPNYSEDGEYYFINGNNLDNGTIQLTELTKKVSKDEYLKHKKELNHHTILVSINGTLGKAAFYSGEKIILGKSACYLNLIPGVTNKIYFFFLLVSRYFMNYAKTQSTGSTIKNVSLKSMREFPVPLPPIPLQNKFANLVEQVELLRVKQKESEEELLNLFNSLMQKYFGS